MDSFDDSFPFQDWEIILILISSCILTTWIILSNLFVILAVLGYGHMRTPSNIYIASLASTDLLVGLLILPLSILQIVHNRWEFSRELCKAWLTLDVTLSTLSILHIIAIACDRYQVVSGGIVYLQRRSLKDVISVIICLWCVGIWIATPPILGWGRWTEIEISKDYICNYNSTWGYVIHSAFGSFLFPMTLMIYTYLKIYRKIQQRLKERACIPSLNTSGENGPSESEMSSSLLRKETFNKDKSPGSLRTRPSSQIHEFMKKKIRFSLTKERRAARTLGIIIGAFLICWMPFCVMYMLRPIAGDPPLVIYHAFTWLGYVNSAVNPVIYCVFSKEFKNVFRNLFCACCKRRNENVIV